MLIIALQTTVTYKPTQSQGQMHHLISSFLPPGEHAPSFAQICIYDPAEQAARRPSVFGDLDHRLLINLHDMLAEVNEFAGVFETAGERLRTNPQANFEVYIQGKAQGRQYAPPTADEIAALIVDGGAEQPATRDVVVFRREG